MQTLSFLPASTVNQLFGKKGIAYSPSQVWGIFKKLASGLPISDAEDLILWDFYLSIGIIVIARKYPTKPVIYKSGQGLITGQDQVDDLMVIVEKMKLYYEADPQKRVIDSFPLDPMSESERRKFHAHFFKKASNLWVDEYRKQRNEPLRRVIDEINESVHIDPASGSDDSDGYSDLGTWGETSTDGFLLNLGTLVPDETFRSNLVSQLGNLIAHSVLARKFKKGLAALSDSVLEELQLDLRSKGEDISLKQLRKQLSAGMKITVSRNGVRYEGIGTTEDVNEPELCSLLAIELLNRPNLRESLKKSYGKQVITDNEAWNRRLLSDELAGEFVLLPNAVKESIISRIVK